MFSSVPSLKEKEVRQNLQSSLLRIRSLKVDLTSTCMRTGIGSKWDSIDYLMILALLSSNHH